ncbi:Calcium-binding and coiled-coil domain-containing protein 1 [Merluccius polli]|uniref:Calcium-binding and coiled-coil domain-containing protein 1 n=1 Tax=Merluccius polli TaxID=89951 RepID=A0AA47NQY7_MERPO|nr:Calcium-binding and coiled-coil domain-containing protein 1 [Merluccius polli]
MFSFSLNSSITMEKQASVVFHNVGQMYFPETRVECHYSLTAEHHWSSKDWIGLFQVGWSSVKDYHTYTWALVPEGYAVGADVNSCALFQAFYLPRPSPVEYQFVYVTEGGEVCAHSRNFTFCSPKPLDELETMKEDRGEEEGDGDEEEEEMLLVIPKAQLLQSQLEDSLKEQEGVKLELEMSQREMETEMSKHKVAQREWECERGAMQKELSELRENLGRNRNKLRTMEGKHKDVKETGESLNSELTQLLSEKEEDELRITDLEEDVRVLTDCGRETDAALERMKERVKKMCDQMKHEEEKRKSVEVK